MHIYIGSDHGGFQQKSHLLTALANEGFTLTDCGTYSKESTDYPDFAVAVGQAVRQHIKSMGILLCRSGEGMEMAANKIPGIRAALVWQPEVAAETRRDNNANVLVLPSDFITNEQAVEIAKRFIHTPFSKEERHMRRIEKMENLERMQP